MEQSKLVINSELESPRQPQIGDRVRFKSGMAPAVLRGREYAIGMVIVLVTRGGSQQWPIVHFGDYITTVLPPGLLDIVESEEGRRDDAGEA